MSTGRMLYFYRDVIFTCFLQRIGRTGRVGNTGRATSYWDWNTDGGIQRDLVNILSDAKQPIPDWLAMGGGRRY